MPAKKINLRRSLKKGAIKEMSLPFPRRMKNTSIKLTLKKKSLASSSKNSSRTTTILPTKTNLRKKRRKEMNSKSLSLPKKI